MDPTRTSAEIPEDGGAWTEAWTEGPISQATPGHDMELAERLGDQSQEPSGYSCRLQTPQCYAIRCRARPQGTGRKASSATRWPAEARTGMEAPACLPPPHPPPTENATLVPLDPARKQGRGPRPRSQQARRGRHGPMLTWAAPSCTWTRLCPGLAAAARILSGLRLERPGSGHCRPGPSCQQGFPRAQTG